MQFKIHQSLFTYTLKIFTDITKKSTNPVLECIQLTVTGDCLALYATNGYNHLETSIPVTGGHNGTIVVKCSDLEKRIKSASEVELILTSDANALIIQQSIGKRLFNLPLICNEDYPVRPKIVYDKINSYELQTSTLLSIINNCKYAVSTRRPDLGAVAFSVLDNTLVGIATDGHRSAIKSVKLNGALGQLDFKIPLQQLDDLYKLLRLAVKNKVEQVLLEIGASSVSITIDDVIYMFAIPLIGSGPFDYVNSITAKELPNGIVIDLIQALEILESLKVASENDMVTLTLDKNTLEFNVGQHPFAASDSMVVNYNGKHKSMSLSIVYLIDMLSELESDTFTFEFIDNDNNILFSVVSTNFRAIVLPMRS